MPDKSRAVHDELVCPSCGYSLRGLQQTQRITCPECGYEDDFEAISAANQAPVEMTVSRWLLLQLAPALVFLALAAFGAMLSAAPDVLSRLAVLILILAVPWCGMLCWNAFKTSWVLGRVFMTMVGAAGYLLANVLACLVIMFGLMVMMRAF